jgi:hypothetical protein
VFHSCWPYGLNHFFYDSGNLVLPSLFFKVNHHLYLEPDSVNQFLNIKQKEYFFLMFVVLAKLTPLFAFLQEQSPGLQNA